MGKALVIKNVNFSTNRLDVVTFGTDVPCVALTLNESAVSLTSIGATFTLVATPMPLNTTDTILWSTSNGNVATVDDGVVSCVGVGSAVITAVCGSITATCTITCTNTLTYEYSLTNIAKQRLPTGGGLVRDYGYLTTGSANYGCLFGGTPTKYRLENTVSSAVPGDKYPIILGQGATKLTADVPSDIRITVWFIDTNTVCDYASEYSGASNFAKLISGDESEYDSTVALGDREMTVPEGANSAIFSLQKPGSGNSVTAEDIASITIIAS